MVRLHRPTPPTDDPIVMRSELRTVVLGVVSDFKSVERSIKRLCIVAWVALIVAIAALVRTL